MIYLQKDNLLFCDSIRCCLQPEKRIVIYDIPRLTFSADLQNNLINLFAIQNFHHFYSISISSLINIKMLLCGRMIYFSVLNSISNPLLFR